MLGELPLQEFVPTLSVRQGFRGFSVLVSWKPNTQIKCQAKTMKQHDSSASFIHGQIAKLATNYSPNRVHRQTMSTTSLPNHPPNRVHRQTRSTTSLPNYPPNMMHRQTRSTISLPNHPPNRVHRQTRSTISLPNHSHHIVRRINYIIQGDRA